MYAKLFVVLFAATSVLGATLNRGAGNGSGNGSCNAGQTACCNSIEQPNTTNYQDLVSSLISQGLLKDIGLGIGGAAVPIGLTCIPITAVAAEIGQNCQTAVTCCDHITNNGLVGVNCTPLNLNL